MSQSTSSEFQPLKYVFYDDLDTVRFNNVDDEERKARAVTTTGNMMAGMLIGRTGTIFSQNQSYDNQLILTLISAEGERAARDDRLGFLKLVSTGLIQVGLLENGPAADPPDGERYTLMNMFRTSLTNRSFLLSGWPELNDNPDLRSEVLDCLNRTLGERLSSAVPGNVAARIEGLREFDRILRTFPHGIRIVSQAEEPLEARVRNMLQAVEPDGDAVRHAAAKVITQATRDSVNLQSRSNWYRLIDLNSQYPYSPEDSAFRVLREHCRPQLQRHGQRIAKR